MKKAIALFFVLIASASFIYSQSSITSEQELKQYQTFKWRPVPHAKRYEVNIEKKIADDTYETALTEKTVQSNLEVLLLPGAYRVSISVFNVLGKKASTSEWVDFIILNETEPYLMKNTFVEDDFYKANVLRRINRVESDVEGVEEELVESKTFTITGRNIFFPESKFSLVPVENKSFSAFNDKRKTVDLQILSRDREESQIEVSVDWTKLHAGFYELTVQNPENHSAKLEVLVLPERTPQLEKTTFSYNNRYKVNTVSFLKNSEPVTFKINGRDFQQDTKFMFVPSQGIPYPFSSEKDRMEIPLSVTESKCINEQTGELEVSLTFDSTKIYTGYYLLAAISSNLQNEALNLLVTVKTSQENKPEVKKIKTEFDKENKNVAFTMEGQRLSFSVSGKQLESSTSAVLIAPCDSKGVNQRIPLSLVNSKKNGKKASFDVDSEMLKPGTYALMVETSSGVQVTYVEIETDYKANLIEVSEEQVEEKFLRSETLEDTVKEEDVVLLEKTMETDKAIEDFIITAEDNEAAFMDSKAWKAYGGPSSCYIKEIDGVKRLATRFSNGSYEDCFIENNSTRALRLLRQSNALRVAIYNPLDKDITCSVVIKVGNEPSTRNFSDSYIKHNIVIKAKETTKVDLPFRKFNESYGVNINRLDTTLIKSIQVKLETREMQNRRFEIEKFEVYKKSEPADMDPFLNEYWWSPNFKTENIQIINGNSLYLKTEKDLSPGVHPADLEFRKYENFSKKLANELQKANGLSFKAKGRKKAYYQFILYLINSETGAEYDMCSSFVLEEDWKEYSLPYSNFKPGWRQPSTQKVVAEDIVGMAIQCCDSKEFVRSFDFDITITDFKFSESEEYFMLKEYPFPEVYTDEGWNLYKNELTLSNELKKEDNRLIWTTKFSGNKQLYLWATATNTNKTIAKELKTAESISFKVNISGQNIYSGKIQFRIIQENSSGKYEYYVKNLQLSKSKEVQVNIDYKNLVATKNAGKFQKERIVGFELAIDYFKQDLDFNCDLEIYDLKYSKYERFQNGMVVDDEQSETLEEIKPIEYKRPIFFTALGANTGFVDNKLSKYANFPKWAYGLELRVVDFNWIVFDCFGNYDSLLERLIYGINTKVSIPWKLFRPYVCFGFGVAHYLSNMGQTVGLYANSSIGILLFNFLDVRYNFGLINANYIGNERVSYGENSFSIGIMITFRKPKPINEDDNETSI